MSEKKQELQVLEKEAKNFALEASMYEINTQMDNDQAIQMIKGAKAISKAIKSILDPFVKDAKKAYDSAKDRRKQHLKDLEEGERILRQKGNAYYQKQVELAEKAKKETEEKIDTEDLSKTEVNIEAKPKKPEGASYRTQWYAEVKDIKALAKAVAEGNTPDIFIQANTPALNRQAMVVKGKSNIPGVEFKSKQIMSVR